MKKKFAWILISGLLIAALLLSACGTAVVEEEEEEEEEVIEEEEEEEEEVVEEGEEAEFVWLDKGGWVRPEFVDNVKNVAVGDEVYLVYPYTLEEPQYGGTLTIHITTDPRGFDPWNQTWKQTRNHEKLMRGDFTWSEEFTTGIFSPEIEDFIGWLAESYEMPDQQTIIYYLREGVRFNSGLPEIREFVGDRELTADDWVYTFEHLSSPNLDTPWVWYYYDIRRVKCHRQGEIGPVEIGVEKIDDYTLRIYGEGESAPHIPALLAYQTSCPVPVHRAKDNPEHWADDKEGFLSISFGFASGASGWPW